MPLHKILTSMAERLLKRKGLLDHTASQKRTKIWGLKSKPVAAGLHGGHLSAVLQLMGIFFIHYISGKKDVSFERFYIGYR